VNENLAALDVMPTLTPEVLQEIDALTAGAAGAAGVGSR